MNKRTLAGATLAALGMGMMQGPAAPREGMNPVVATSRADIGAWDQRIGALASRGDLQIRSVRADTMLEGRTHTRFAQLHQGVPVWGGELVRQEDAAGTLSVFGGLLEGIDVDTRPRLGEVAARSALLRSSPQGSTLFPDEVILTILPLDEGGYALTWRARVFTGSDIRMTFLDANNGEVVLDYSDLQTQSAVGVGVGVLGDRKKLSVTAVGPTYQAQDALRPPVLQTLDMKGSLDRLFFIFDHFPSSISANDFASDSDNEWTDGAAVDAPGSRQRQHRDSKFRASRKPG